MAKGQVKSNKEKKKPKKEGPARPKPGDLFQQRPGSTSGTGTRKA